MTLYQKLRNEMENHRGFWNYYGVNFDDVFRDEGVARDFIYNYFKGGSKLNDCRQCHLALCSIFVRVSENEKFLDLAM